MASNEYHFVITIQFHEGDSDATRTTSASGTVAVRSGETRQALYQRVLTSVTENLSASSPVVLFFDLAPNDL